MSLLVGTGYSQDNDITDAVDESFATATKPLEGNPPSFIMVLASSTAYDQEKLVRQIKDRYPQSPMIGASTSGEITNFGPYDGSLAVMAIYSDKIKFIPAMGENIKKDAKLAGINFAENVFKNNNNVKPKTALILPDGLAGNGADIVRGITEVFGKDFKLAGGSAGDDFLFKETYQYFDGEVYSGNIVGVGLEGDFAFGIGVRHGWIPVGTSRLVTHSKSNVLYELDGKPAIDIYKDQFGEDIALIKEDEPFARQAITYPLGIALKGQEEYLIRDPLSVDEKGGITCAAEIPEGSEVYIMIGSPDEAIAAAQTAATQALDEVRGRSVKAVFLFNCIARKKLLMNKKEEEIRKVQEIFGLDVPLIGFYTYGEQAPLGVLNATCEFHNETDVIFALAE